MWIKRCFNIFDEWFIVMFNFSAAFLLWTWQISNVSYHLMINDAQLTKKRISEFSIVFFSKFKNWCNIRASFFNRRVFRIYEISKNFEQFVFSFFCHIDEKKLNRRLCEIFHNNRFRQNATMNRSDKKNIMSKMKKKRCIHCILWYRTFIWRTRWNQIWRKCDHFV